MAHTCEHSLAKPDGKGLYWCPECDVTFEDSVKRYTCGRCKIYYMTWPEKLKHYKEHASSTS